jgi:hypothetical protein
MLQDAVMNKAGRISVIIDRLVHNSTTEIDIVVCVNALRRLTCGRSPCDILLDAVPKLAIKPRDLERLRKQHAEMESENHLLAVKLDDVREENRIQQRQIEELERQLAARPIPEVLPELEFYSYYDVMEIARRQFGKTHGVLQAWATFNDKLRAHDPDLPRMTTTLAQSWRKANKFPAWAVDQLRQLDTISMPRMRWTVAHMAFLKASYLARPTITDEELAQLCTAHFHHEVNTNCVKSKLGHLRALREVPSRDLKARKATQQEAVAA